MSEAGTIAVVGSINVDLIVHVQRHPSPGETVHGQGGMLSPGGKGANQAAAAARLGGQVRMVGAVGTDAHAEIALSGLTAAGVDLGALRTVDGPTGMAVVTVAADGENSIVVVDGANGSVDGSWIAEEGEILEGAAVVVCQGEIPREGIEALPGMVRGRFLHNPAPVIALDPEVLRASDPLVVNEHEAGLVLAQLRPDAAGVGEPEQIVAALRDAGIASVVLTLGAAGAVVADADGTCHLPAPRVRAVDTTGAGDAFIGALAVGLARGESLRESAALAARVGAFAVTGHGAQPSYPDTASTLPPVEEEPAAPAPAAGIREAQPGIR